MEIAVIVNPISGGGKATRNLKTIEEAFRQSGANPQFFFSKERGHAYELALSLSSQSEFDAVVAAGGDGTVNETAHGLVGSPTPLGILPLGSGNGLARQLGMSMRIPEACRMIAQGRPIRIDSGLNNGKPFFVTSGIGFDGLVAHQFALSKRRGLTSYVAAVLKMVRQWKPFEAEIEVITGNQTIAFSGRYSILVAANAEQYGNNAYIAPGAYLDDGLLNLTSIGNVSIVQIGALCRSLFNKTLDRHNPVQLQAGTQFRINTEKPQFFHLDGEPSGETSSFNIEIRPASLTVLTALQSRR